MFPNIPATGGAVGAGIFNPGRGGFSANMGFNLLDKYLIDIKPTVNTNLSWVKGNHSYKMGGELIIEGFPTLSYLLSTGVYNFNAQQSVLTGEYDQPLHG